MPLPVEPSVRHVSVLYHSVSSCTPTLQPYCFEAGSVAKPGGGRAGRVALGLQVVLRGTESVLWAHGILSNCTPSGSQQLVWVQLK